MDNLFLEVFPEVKLDSKIKEIAAQCKILKISKSKESDCVRILLESKYLISYKNIDKLESLLLKWYFEEYSKVEIYPKFVLSSQYNLQNLWDEYSDTVLFEETIASFIYHAFKKRCDF